MKTFFIVIFFLSVYSAAEKFNYDLSLVDLDGKKSTLKPFKGKKLIILFFSVNCASCKVAVSRVEELMKGKTCLFPVGIITAGDPEKTVVGAKKKFRFPGPLYYDREKSFRNAYGFEFVPRTMFVDENGEIRGIIEEFYQANYDFVFDLNVRKACGEAHLEKSLSGRFYGRAVCRYCHLKEDSAWKADRHAKAYATLAEKYFKKTGYRKGDEKRMDPECLRCHTTGFGETGGAGTAGEIHHLQGVQCEACHSRAGPHDGEGAGDYEEQCVRCHTSVRDPVFNYSSGLKKLSHP
jgi:thioredoxin-related protein